MKKKPAKGLQALASGTLALARFHTILDKTERQLEHELERENREPAKTIIGRARRKGEQIIHSKHVLFCVVLLNIIDCILVLGELILDMYYIKSLMESSEAVTTSFVIDIKNLYPNELYGLYSTDIQPLYDRILHARIEWNNSTYDSYISHQEQNIFTDNITTGSLHQRTAPNMLQIKTTSGNDTGNNSYSHFHDYHAEHAHSIEEVLAHAFHKASITILCILAAETLFKIFAYGKSFFERKLEVFDCIIVYCSLFVDLYYLKGISAFPIQEFVIILAFLVPWRVIRVVNSLVVAVIDHEHFRLKLLYKQKKDVSNELKKVKADSKVLQQSLDIVKKMALDAGIQESKISQHLALLQQKKRKNRTFEDNFKKGLPLFNIRTSQMFDEARKTETSRQSSFDSGNNNEISNTADIEETRETDIVLNIDDRKDV